MPNNRTLTSANAVLYIQVAGLYPVPQHIQGFTADDVTSLGAISPKETSMGVDGRLSAGWAAVAVPQTIMLKADSLSNDFFENWAQAEATARETYIATGSITLPSVERKYTLVRGFLTEISPMPEIKRMLADRRWTITWEKVQPAPF